MVQIDDLDGAGEVGLGKIPDPFRPIAHYDLFCSATPSAIPGLQVDAFAELFGGLDGAGIGGGVGIPDRVAFFVPTSLREYASQLDFPGVGWLTFRLALPAHRFFL